MMKKTAIRILIGLTAAVVLLLAVLPFALPPVAQRIAEDKLAAFGFPACVRMSLAYGWNSGPEISGTLRLDLLDAPVAANASFDAGFGRWRAQLTVPQTTLTESDPAVRRLLDRHPLKGSSNLVFSAGMSLEASAERTRQMPVPVWSVKLPLRDVSASLIREGLPLAVDGLSATLGASGIARHVDIAPVFLRIPSANAGGFALTNVSATVRATEKSLLVTEARAGVCAGTASLYSLFLDPKTLNAGFTLFIDNIDAGKVLGQLKGFRGEASGRLHGKLRLFAKEGGRILRFGNAFLYSTPGETGKLKMEDSGAFTENLALAGVDESSRDNVSNALKDLDYSVLRLDLKRTAGDTATLGVKLSGSATRGTTTVPVDLTVNLNGKLEQLVNTGLGLSNRLKGTRK